jgi:hypothetical protein
VEKFDFHSSVKCAAQVHNSVPIELLQRVHAFAFWSRPAIQEFVNFPGVGYPENMNFLCESRSR